MFGNRIVRYYGPGAYTTGVATGSVAPTVPAANVVVTTAVSPAAGQRVRATVVIKNTSNADIIIASIVANLVAPTTGIVQGHLDTLAVGVLPTTIPVNSTATFALEMAQGIATTSQLPATLNLVFEVAVSGGPVFVFGINNAINVPAPTYGMQMPSASLTVI